MKRQKYRILAATVDGVLDGDSMVMPSRVTTTAYLVQVRRWYGWVTVKEFHDPEDPDFARREAEELLETLEG